MKIVFLDRDGVINRFPGRGKYVTRVKDFHFLPRALRAIRLLTQRGFTIFVVSNQAGVSRGVYSQKKLDQITQYMLKFVSRAGGKIKKVFYCTHTAEENCNCRKPNIGSLEEAFTMVGLNPKRKIPAYFIGDAQMDMEAGKRAGCTTILVLTGIETRRSIRDWPLQPDSIVRDLWTATQIVINENPHHLRLRRRRTHQGR